MFGFFKNELLEVIEWKEESSDVVLWKFPDKDSNIKYGAQLTVRESQAAVFLNEGQIADVYPAGRHELKTENMPILTTLKSWKHGFNSPFKADVYFVSSRQFSNLKWGTPNSIFITDENAGKVGLRAFGVYFIRIKDPKTFFRQYAGTKSIMYIDELQDDLRGLIAPKFAEALQKSGASATDVYSNYTALGEKIRPLLQAELEPLGIELTKFQISSTSFSAEDEQRIKDTSVGDKGIDKLARFNQMDVLKTAAEKGNYENFQNSQNQMMMQQMMMQQMMQQQNQQPQNFQQQNFQQQQQQNQAGGEKLSRAEVMSTLKELGELKQMGILSDEEFETKKKELLAQL